MDVNDLYQQPQVYHYFKIAEYKFHCSLETEYTKTGNPVWIPWCNSGFGIDYHKQFKTPEACERYMRKKIKQRCKAYLRDLK